MNVTEILVTPMRNVQTLMAHLCVLVRLDILEMDWPVQVW